MDSPLSETFICPICKRKFKLLFVGVIRKNVTCSEKCRKKQQRNNNGR